ncbi:DNA polymerase III subunit alpha [Texas Phoenix palm phytoplasma]|uniref:DNA polymerase III PolC-type n=1 Tax=Texas Phoenix palm phytoplasma TaxID=176709 RepID=A0ABS5BIV8_9MOLU|nr:DNA polymerase III subunit alpha [Texas Phoenix palm phytoplasma]MBP3059528.1 DNA polymerase III subunit alpha [Texas Phoenix palm phytoplasma]
MFIPLDRKENKEKLIHNSYKDKISLFEKYLNNNIDNSFSFVFKKVKIKVLEKTWNLYFFTNPIKSDIIKSMDNFEKKVNEFIEKKSKKIIKNLKTNIFFELNSISNLEKEVFLELLYRILKKRNKDLTLFNFLKNRIIFFNFEMKICEFKSIELFVFEYLPKKYFEEKIYLFLDEITKLFLHEYSVFFNFKILIRKNNFISSNNYLNFDNIDNININDETLIWNEKFYFILDLIIKQKKENKIFEIFKYKIDYVDFELKICEFFCDCDLIKYFVLPDYYVLNKIKKILKELQVILKEKYGVLFKFKIKDIKEIKDIEKTQNMNKVNIKEIINKENNKIEYIDFNSIPITNDKIKEFRKKYSYFKIKGYIQQKEEYVVAKGRSILFSFYLLEPLEKKDSILYRKFFLAEEENLIHIRKNLKEGILVEIDSFVDKYEKNQEFYFSFNFDKKNSSYKPYKIINSVPFQLKRMDNYKGKKRIEFHLHTKMSNLDAVTSAKDYIDTAIRWQHEAIAFTDHDGIYVYPEIYKHTKNKNIKPILGLEINFNEEKPVFITNQEDYPYFSDFNLKKNSYVVFDLETTGLSKNIDKIIELSAVKIENGKITDECFNQLINPEIDLSQKIIDLTGIQNDDLKNKPTIEKVFPKFLEFIEGYTLVAHNAFFDIGFLEEVSKKLNFNFNATPVIDTLNLARKHFNSVLKFFNLQKISKFFKIKNPLEGKSHRALFDSYSTGLIFLEMIKQLEEQNILTFYDLKGSLPFIIEQSYHVNILVKNQIGYKNLFSLLSDSLTKDFYKKPIVMKSNFVKNREGLLIGSGCFDGKVFNTALYQNDKDLSNVISFYDYIEVQPINAYKHIIFELSGNNKEYKIKIIQDTIMKIIKEAKRQNKIVIATGDVHYLSSYDKIYREVYINAKLIGGGLHRLSNYNHDNLPDNYFLTTQEMLDSFSFIEDEQLRQDLVINNTHLLNEKIEKINILPEKLFFLKDNAFSNNLNVPSIKKEIEFLIKEKTKSIYGEHMHPLVEKRIFFEFEKIIDKSNNSKSNPSIAPIYYLTYLLVKKSIEDGFPVGSRGSIGSSLIANILEITEVNPLKPHYRCSQCQYTVFPQMSEEEKKEKKYQNYINSKNIDKNDYNSIKGIFSGYDLPDMNCPFCFKKFIKDGQDIPFETFLGFEGNKTPDIDLNFSGNYQSKAHGYIKELLGSDYVFRAGTIQTVAKRNAFGYIKGFIKDKNLEDKIRFCEINRRTHFLEGVKRSTGQHPGGIVVVPNENSIFEITPVQFPANDITSSWKTTHFDYHSFENNLFKMDILGHDDPMLIKFFMDYVHKNPEKFPFNRYQDIPTDDPKVYRIFSQTVKNISSLAIPEFGTKFVIDILKNIYKKEKKDFNFATLVKVSGLSHGTDVWIKNAQDVLKKQGDFENNTADKNISFDDIICCRDDIMNTLINRNVEKLKSFEIMEFVRKGKQHSNPKEWTFLVKEIENKVEEWYIKSLSKIKYLFPKAHAAAYVLMAVRIAWFKVNFPLLFYSGFFSTRVEQFDYELMITNDIEKINSKLSSLNKKNITAKEQNIFNTLLNASEMISRKFKFLPIDLNKSDAYNFIIEGDKCLIMPFISIDGLGKVLAENIVKEREKKLFTQKDFLARIKINKTILKKLKEEFKIIEKLPKE